MVAIHDDYDIVESFVMQQNNANDFTIVKIKKKKMKKMEKEVDIEELYLVRYGSEYVPYGYYATLKTETKQSAEDYQYCIDILFRLLEEGEMTRKESKTILKTISIIMDRTEEPSGLNLQDLETLKRLNTEYREKVL